MSAFGDALANLTLAGVAATLASQEEPWPTCGICGWRTPDREQPFAQAQAAQHLNDVHHGGRDGSECR